MISTRKTFLSVPDFFEAKDVPSGNSIPSGIISRIRSETSDITSYVEPISSPNYTTITGSARSLVTWSGYIQLIYKDDEGYLQVEFKQGYVYPISYSIKGYNYGYFFAKEWYLYGYNKENEKTLLSENKSEGSTFCSTERGCSNGNWATFSVNPVQKAFKYFRIVCKTSSSNNDNKYLLLSGFELFGVYSVNAGTKDKENHQMTRITVSKLALYSLLRLIIYIS